MTQREYFHQFHPLGEEEYRLLTQDLKPRSFVKGEHITVPGQVQKALYFVHSGVQMSYFETEKKTHVVAFTYPPGLCAIPESFSFQSPSKYYLTCLTDSNMSYLSFEALQRLFDRSQAIERLFRRMTEAVLAGVVNRHLELHALSMEARYKAFCRRSPHLLGLAPHKYIASYLGIDATNFSKLFNSVKF
jgi:CRP-like cAMP-binding protein